MRKISELFFGLKCKFLGNSEVYIDNLSDDSRSVTRTSAFFAVAGTNLDGNSFIPDVIDRGCVVIVTEHLYCQVDGITFVLVDDIRTSMAVVAKRFFGAPDEFLYIYCVTGTNGKTSITYLIEHLEDRKTAILGTVGYKVGAEEMVASNTTPGSIGLFGLLDCAGRNGCEVVAMEASSHGLHQKRTYGLAVDRAIFSNLTDDHLEYHGGIDNYFQAKEILFSGANGSRPDLAVVNVDDSFGKILAKKLRNIKELRRLDNRGVVSYGMTYPADFQAVEVFSTLDSTSFTLNAFGKSYHCELPLIGKHNVLNALAAIAAMGDENNIAYLVEKIRNFPGIPGRLQRVHSNIGISVFIDYAHTEDALVNVLSTLKPLTRNKLIVVFGCGGGRDRCKRPKMTSAALKLGDVVIATSDNPRNEAISDIFFDMKNGVRDLERVLFIESRAEAIYQAISVAVEGDTVLIAGKGHEKFQQFFDKKIHFDDLEVAVNALNEI